MGPSPTIPTSFVPKQPVHPAARFEKSGGNILLLIASFMLVFALVGAVGVFAYGAYLDGVLKSKAAELSATEASVNTDAVEEFIRFRDRFAAAEEVLNGHIATSNFFDLLEKLTLANVRFASLAFESTEDGVFKIGLDGTARSFNALAAQSKAFADEPTIKRAIFANIATELNGTVSFSVTAELDPSLLEFSVNSLPTPVPVSVPTTPVATTTASTTPSVAPTAPVVSPTAPTAPTTPSTPSPVSL